MRKMNRHVFVLAMLLCFGLFTSVAQASSIHGEEIYEMEGVYVFAKPFGKPTPTLIDSFEIATAGDYIAEFEYFLYPGVYNGHAGYSGFFETPPVLGVTLSNSAGVLGNSIGIGSFTFSADAGTHTLEVKGLPGELFTMGVALFEVEITAVPVPAAFILFGSALVALFGTVKRRRMTASKQYTGGLVAA